MMGQGIEITVEINTPKGGGKFLEKTGFEPLNNHKSDN